MSRPDLAFDTMMAALSLECADRHNLAVGALLSVTATAGDAYVASCCYADILLAAVPLCHCGKRCKVTVDFEAVEHEDAGAVALAGAVVGGLANGDQRGAAHAFLTAERKEQLEAALLLLRMAGTVTKAGQQ